MNDDDCLVVMLSITQECYRCCYASLIGRKDTYMIVEYCCHSGVGQLICRKLIDTVGFESVRAISRNVESCSAFELLNGCDFIQVYMHIDTHLYIT